jgi:hypothetical protein
MVRIPYVNRFEAYENLPCTYQPTPFSPFITTS